MITAAEARLFMLDDEALAVLERVEATIKGAAKGRMRCVSCELPDNWDLALKIKVALKDQGFFVTLRSAMDTPKIFVQW